MAIYIKSDAIQPNSITIEKIVQSDAADLTTFKAGLGEYSAKQNTEHDLNNANGKHSSAFNTIDSTFYCGHFLISTDSTLELNVDGECTYKLNSTFNTLLFDETISSGENQILVNGAKLIRYDETASTLTFDKPVYFYVYSNEKRPLEFKNKYIKLGYKKPVEKGSVANGAGASAHNSSSALNTGDNAVNNAYVNAGFGHAEGTGGSSVKSYKHFGGDYIEGTKQSGYTGTYGYGSHTEGNMTITTQFGSYSHAEGHSTVADNYAAHSEGRETLASGVASHAEGGSTTAAGSYSHVEGKSSTEYMDYYGYTNLDNITNKWLYGKDPDNGDTTHMKNFSIAVGEASHVEGINNIATGVASHSGGIRNATLQDYSHTSGLNCINDAIYSFVHGANLTTEGDGNAVFGLDNICNGARSIVAGKENEVNSNHTIVAGEYNIENGSYSAVFGSNNCNNGGHSIIAGENNTNSGSASAVFGADNECQNDYTMIVGKGNTIQGSHSLIIGEKNTSTKTHTFTGGTNNTNNGICSFVYGNNVKVLGGGECDIAAGQNITSISGQSNNIAFGENIVTYKANAIAIGHGSQHYDSINAIDASFFANANIVNNYLNGVEVADKTIASRSIHAAYDKDSITLGKNCLAYGNSSIAIGNYLCAKDANSIILGNWNDTSIAKSIFVIGCGTTNKPANALRIDTSGKLYIKDVETDVATLLNKIETLEREIAALKAK